MKKLIAAILIAMPVAASAAQTATDVKARTLFQDLTASENFHLLDNLTPATFYDFKTKNWYAGGVTSIYTYGQLSADLGLINSIEQGGTTALPTAGLNYHFGTTLNKMPAVKSLTSKVQDASLLNNFSAGAWVCRDWERGLTMYGVYTGIEIKWGKLK